MSATECYSSCFVSLRPEFTKLSVLKQGPVELSLVWCEVPGFDLTGSRVQSISAATFLLVMAFPSFTLEAYYAVCYLYVLSLNVVTANCITSEGVTPINPSLVLALILALCGATQASLKDRSWL